MSEHKNNTVPETSNCEVLQVEWGIADIFSQNEIKDFCSQSPPFMFAEWLWEIGARRDSAIDFLRLRIQRSNSCPGPSLEDRSPIKFKLGFKKKDGDVEYILSSSLYSYDVAFLNEEELLDRRNELAPSNTLTITCTLKLVDIANISSHGRIPFKFINLNMLKSNLEKYSIYDLESWRGSFDVTLQVEEKNFKANKDILVARSPVFAVMFDHDWSEKQTGTINIPDCDPESFQDFLVYLHSGELQDISFCSALHLYSTSEKYNVPELKCFCAEYLQQNLTEDNVCDVVVLADMYEDRRLMSAAQNFFNSNLSKIVITSAWENLLRDDYRLANKLIIKMSTKIHIKDCQCSTKKFIV